MTVTKYNPNEREFRSVEMTNKQFMEYELLNDEGAHVRAEDYFNKLYTKQYK